MAWNEDINNCCAIDPITPLYFEAICNCSGIPLTRIADGHHLWVRLIVLMLFVVQWIFRVLDEYEEHIFIAYFAFLITTGIIPLLYRRYKLGSWRAVGTMYYWEFVDRYEVIQQIPTAMWMNLYHLGGSYTRNMRKESILTKLPSKIKDTMTDCPICLEISKSEYYSIECGHKFHSECLMTWLLEGHDNCPMCMKCVYSSNTESLTPHPNK